MAARSNDEVRSLRDQILMKEQTRWMTAGSIVLETKPREPVAIEQIQQALAPSAVLLEYVIADPTPYCLVISRDGSRIVRLSSKASDRSACRVLSNGREGQDCRRTSEARRLYDALLGPIRETSTEGHLIIVPDGQLALVPFDGLDDRSATM